MPDELERTIERSLADRARQLGDQLGSPGLGAVWSRVEARRSRRRGAATVGSVAVIAVGIAAIATLGGGGADTQAPGTATATTAPTAPNPTPPATMALADDVWRCEGQVGADDTFVYYERCELLPAGAPGSWPPTTVPVEGVGVMTVPPSMPPSTPPSVTSPVEQVHTVVAGDSLILIATMFGIGIDDLVDYNGWPEGIDHMILPDEVVLIPPGAIVVGSSPGTVPDASTVPVGTLPPATTSAP